MASQGPNFPGTVTTETGPSGDNDWTNPSNVGADDGSEAQITAATYDAGDHSFRLRASNFGFSIPGGATIDGIVVEIERRDFAGDAQDQEVRLFDSTGTLVGDDKQTATSWPATATIATYGGATDTWNAGLDVADINSANFGVALIVLANSANTDIGVDFIRVTVHYTVDPNVTVTPSPVAIPLVIPAPRINVDTPYQDKVESYLPVMYWPLGEGGGTTAYDERSGAHHGTYEGTPALGGTGIGDGGAAATFDGDDRVSIPDHADLDFTSPFSIMAWVKSDGALNFVDNAVWGKGTGGVPYLWITGTGQSPAGRVALAKSDTADIVQTGALITDTAWHCIIAVYEHNVTGKIYVDGVDEGGTPTYNAFSTNAIAAAIGSKTGASGENTWGGSIAHVAIFDYALDATEAADLSTIPAAGDVTLTPSPVTLPLVVPAPTLQVGRVMTPSPVAVPLVVPAPSIQAGRVVNPDPVALPLVVPAPAIQVGAQVTPDPVSLVLVVPVPTITAEGGAPAVTVTPDPVAVVLAIPTPSIQSGRLVSPSPVALPLVIPSPSIAAGALVSPSPVAVPLVVPAPSIQAGRIVTPSPVTIPLLIPAPAIAIGARVTPSPVVINLVIPAPTITASGALPPGFLDELLELAVAGDVVTVENLDGGSAGMVIVVTIAGVGIDAGGVLELDVEG